MKITTIHGTLTSHGGSKGIADGLQQYHHLTFQEVGGGELIARNVRVWGDVDRLLQVGSQGTFVIGKDIFAPNELHAIRIGEHEAFNPYIKKGLAKAYAIMGVMLILGLALSFILIGIPIALMAIYRMIQVPRMRRKLQDTLRAEGFKMATVREI
ncbi:MAG: hypothetical protein R2811_16270 [Flavobacteriales bacterium]